MLPKDRWDITWRLKGWYFISPNLFSTCFKNVICSSSGGVLYKILAVFQHPSCEESSCRHNIIRIVSATRLLIRCIVKYCKQLVQNSSWWWTITFSKHVEDKLSEINYYEKCASSWSFSGTSITMHGPGNVKYTNTYSYRTNFVEVSSTAWRIELA
jgi:hypothetical protein